MVEDKPPFVAAWPQVLAIRFADRLGKGIRTSPRDAMLARFAPEATRGRVYGFHRANPEMPLPPGEHRKSAVAATSSGVVMRRSEIFSR